MSKFTFDHFHHYRAASHDEPALDHVKSQPQLPYVGKPGHRYGRGSPLPGASLKGRYDSPSSSSLRSYKPTKKPPLRPPRSDRSSSTSKLPLQISMGDMQSPRLSQSGYRPYNTDTVSLPGRFSSAPRTSYVSPYASIISRSPSVQSLKQSRSAFMFPVDPEEGYPRNISSSASVGYLDDQRFRASVPSMNGYADPLPSNSNYHKTYPPRSSSASLDGISSPRYRGLSQNTSRKESDNLSVSSLGSSSRYSKKMPAPRYSSNYSVTIPTSQEVKTEKLNLLASQFRDALVQDSHQFDGVVPNQIYFPTKCPRTALLQDARSRIVQMTLMWKHAAALTINHIDHVTDVFRQLKSEQADLQKTLADKRATINLMVQQQRSLSNYLEHLRQQASDRGLGSLVYERNPLLTKHIEEFTKERSKHPIDGQIYQFESDNIHDILKEEKKKKAEEVKQKEKGAINLLDVAASADDEIYDGMPLFAKRILSNRSTNLLDSLSLQSSRPSSRSSSPSVSRSNSFSMQPGGNRSNFTSPRSMSIQPGVPSSSSNARPVLNLDQYQEYGMDDNMDSQAPNRPLSRIAAQRGHFLTPLETNMDQPSNLDDVDMSHLDEWGLAISAATPSANANAMAKSMALKNLSIRAMIALSPHKRILDKAKEFDNFDNFSPNDDVDHSAEFDPTATNLSLTPTQFGRERASEPSMSTGFGSATTTPKTPSSPSPTKSPRMRLQPPSISPQPMQRSPMMTSNAREETKSPQFSGLSLHDLVNVDFISPERANGFQQTNHLDTAAHHPNHRMNGHHENGMKAFPNPMLSNGHMNHHANHHQNYIHDDKPVTQQGFVVQNKTPQELSMSNSPRGPFRPPPQQQQQQPQPDDYNPSGLARMQRQPIAASHFLKTVVSAASPKFGVEHVLPSPRPITPTQAPKRPPPRAPG
jgi:hypothetical protein